MFTGTNIQINSTHNKTVRIYHNTYSVFRYSPGNTHCDSQWKTEAIAQGCTYPTLWHPLINNIRDSPGGQQPLGFLVNPLRAKFLRENINIYLHFMSFLHTNKIQVAEIPTGVRRRPAYSTQSILWLLMSWRRKEPGHQQPWYWPSLTELTRSPHVKGLFSECDNSLCMQFPSLDQRRFLHRETNKSRDKNWQYISRSVVTRYGIHFCRETSGTLVRLW